MFLSSTNTLPLIDIYHDLVDMIFPQPTDHLPDRPTATFNFNLFSSWGITKVVYFIKTHNILDLHRFKMKTYVRGLIAGFELTLCSLCLMNISVAI